MFLVGAGPGDPGLLTLRGAELLRSADVVIHDALANPELLKLAPESAEILFGGRRAKGRRIAQEQITALLIEKAKAGKKVVRLKGGDPYLFGRGGEEAEALAKARVPFEVVPGVSSFAAVPNYAGVPLTHRDYASKLTILTGHADPESPDCKIDWAAEARASGTKVVMMGTDRIGQLAEVLMRHGMPKTTPVAMISWGTWGRQKSVDGTLATIAKVVSQARLQPPTIAVIGDVVKLRPRLNWFEKLPLFGQRIVVTRSKLQAPALVKALGERGAETVEIPCIRTVAPEAFEPLKDALLGLYEYDWLIFTSVNGVRHFFEYFEKGFDDARDIGGVRIAAVGPATAEALKARRLHVDAMPKDALGVNIAKAMQKHESIENLRACLLRAEVASPEVPQKLEELGAIVDDIACYRTVAETDVSKEAVRKLSEEGADWVTFTSGSTARHFHQRFNLPELLKKHPAMRIASIGPETTKVISTLGVEPHVEARAHTTEGLVAALEKAVRADRKK